MGNQVQNAPQAADQQSDAGKQADREKGEKEREKEIRGVPGHLPPEPKHEPEDYAPEPTHDPFRFEPPPGRPGHEALQRKAEEEREPLPGITGILQRHALPGSHDPRPSATAETLRAMNAAGGRPLEPGVRQRMEASFGEPLGDVRIHQGGAAAAIGATAFTHGNQIHFAPGSYDPHGAKGRALLGHELTHVIQQRAGRVAVPQGKALPINDDAGLEREADVLGEKAARGEPVSVRGSAAGIQAKFSKRVVKRHLDAAIKDLAESDEAEKVDDESLTEKQKKEAVKEKQEETRELLRAHVKGALENIDSGAKGKGGKDGEETDEDGKKKKKDGMDLAAGGMAAAGMAASLLGPIGMFAGLGLMAGAGAIKAGKGIRDYGRKKRDALEKKKKKGGELSWMERKVWSKFKSKKEVKEAAEKPGLASKIGAGAEKLGGKIKGGFKAAGRGIKSGFGKLRNRFKGKEKQQEMIELQELGGDEHEDEDEDL